MHNTNLKRHFNNYNSNNKVQITSSDFTTQTKSDEQN